ncbi:MAG: DUF7793 family protein [Bacteroidia bacterium]
MNGNFFENNYIKAWYDNNIVFAEFKINKLDLEAAKQTVMLRLGMVQGVNHLVLIDAQNVKTITKEARDYFASDEGTKFIIASALVLDSTVGKILGNFFLQISRPKVPLRLFTNKGDALEWLNTFQD